jgi:hypothetical protein
MPMNRHIRGARLIVIVIFSFHTIVVELMHRGLAQGKNFYRTSRTRAESTPNFDLQKKLMHNCENYLGKENSP